MSSEWRNAMSTLGDVLLKGEHALTTLQDVLSSGERQLELLRQIDTDIRQMMLGGLNLEELISRAVLTLKDVVGAEGAYFILSHPRALAPALVLSRGSQQPTDQDLVKFLVKHLPFQPEDRRAVVPTHGSHSTSPVGSHHGRFADR